MKISVVISTTLIAEHKNILRKYRNKSIYFTVCPAYDANSDLKIYNLINKIHSHTKQPK